MQKAKMLALALLMSLTLAGCGKSDDAVVQEQVELMKQMHGVLEKITDAASAKAAEAELKQLKEKAAELDKVVRTWPKDRRAALSKKHNLDELGEKVLAAYKKAQPYLP